MCHKTCESAKEVFSVTARCRAKSLRRQQRPGLCKMRWSSASTVSVNAQAPQPSIQSVVHHDNGVEISSAADTLRVDALRPDVLRVRLYPAGHPAEDASGAVLSEARTAHTAVTSTGDGFKTSSLMVYVSPDLKLTVTDLAGNVLQSDVAPVPHDGDAFRVSKSRAAMVARWSSFSPVQ